MKLYLVLASMTAFLLLLGCEASESAAPTATIPVPSPRPVTLDDLRAQLQSDAAITRLDAITKLEKEGSPEAVRMLGEFFLNSDVSERFDAARALLRINTPEAQGYVRTAMSDQNLTARRQLAMQALEAHGEAGAPFLQSLLRDPDEAVRLNTVQVVQFMGSARARTLLQSALKDSSPRVQKAAADALEGLGYVPSPTP